MCFSVASRNHHPCDRFDELLCSVLGAVISRNAPWPNATAASQHISCPSSMRGRSCDSHSFTCCLLRHCSHWQPWRRMVFWTPQQLSLWSQCWISSTWCSGEHLREAKRTKYCTACQRSFVEFMSSTHSDIPRTNTAALFCREVEDGADAFTPSPTESRAIISGSYAAAATLLVQFLVRLSWLTQSAGP